MVSRNTKVKNSSLMEKENNSSVENHVQHNVTTEADSYTYVVHIPHPRYSDTFHILNIINHKKLLFSFSLHFLSLSAFCGSPTKILYGSFISYHTDKPDFCTCLTCAQVFLNRILVKAVDHKWYERLVAARENDDSGKLECVRLFVFPCLCS